MHLKRLYICIPDNHNIGLFTYHYIAITTIDSIYEINAKMKNKYIAKPIQIILELVHNSSYDEG